MQYLSKKNRDLNRNNYKIIGSQLMKKGDKHVW